MLTLYHAMTLHGTINLFPYKNMVFCVLEAMLPEQKLFFQNLMFMVSCGTQIKKFAGYPVALGQRYHMQWHSFGVRR